MKMPAVKRKGTYLKVLVTILVLVAIVLGGLYAWKQHEKVEPPSIFEGEVACLPLKSVSDVSEETPCQEGLMDKEGLYFAIQDISQGKLKVGERITIEGHLEPVTEETEGDYAISGVISGKVVTARG